MNIYPALRSKMGSWKYYVVKMSARELSENVNFATQVHESKTLDDAIQRTLKVTKNKEIVEYLKWQPARFFSSIVVAALEGNPIFYPVHVTEDPHFALFHDDEHLNETFGVLKFDGKQKYYALDGQHRLSAIKTLLDRNNSLSDGAPEGFENDEFSVIVIVPDREESHETFMQRYRRLFTNLNRYATPTDQATNIIMDEDDTFAIVTRRLITEHDFFKSADIKTRSGKNLTPSESTSSYFTSIETLYEMNIELLSSSQRRPKRWGPIAEEGTDLKTFKRFRPSEEYINSLYDELVTYWDALLAKIQDLRKYPGQMRVHALADDESENEAQTDHLLFWPIGQQMLAEIVRTLLDKRLTNPENPTLDAVRAALRGIDQLEWRLHQAPWRYFLLVYNTGKERWAMRNEQRTPAVRCGRIIQQWVIGLEDFDEHDVEDLQKEWANFLTPSQTKEESDRMWAQVEELKTTISG